MYAMHGWLLHVQCHQKALAAFIAARHSQLLCSHCFTSAWRKSASSQGGEPLLICAGMICGVFAEAHAQLWKIAGLSILMRCSNAMLVALSAMLMHV